MSEAINTKKLIHTELGQKWLAQFDPLDQEIATAIANNLLLISHNEFERNLISKLNDVVLKKSGSVAFFAIREMAEPRKIKKYMNCSGEKFHFDTISKAVPYYEQVQGCEDGVSVVPLGNTADVGSEGRIASIIRQFCKKSPKKFLNHPTLEHMRSTKCDAIICVDDFIGTGGRTHEFLDTLWEEKTIVSWHSSKLIEFHVVSYSGIEEGVKRTEEHKSTPKVHTHRDAPTFYALPWSEESKEAVFDLCKKYGHKANKKRKHMWLGYKKSMSAIIFEHGCPNNAPAILVDENNGWVGLFPDRTIADTTFSVFPNEISKKITPKHLEAVGQKKLARSIHVINNDDEGKFLLTILALIAKGKSKRSTLCFATGLNNQECDNYLSNCIKWGFVSPSKRITRSGSAELKAAKKIGRIQTEKLAKGSDYYYPKQLRKAT